MFKNIWNRILAMFGKKQVANNEKMINNDIYAYQYQRTDDINFTAIFSNKLANYTVSDCSIDVSGDDKRSELLNEVMKRLVKKLKKFVSRELGTGGALVIPFVTRNKIYFNIISQNRLSINKRVGEDIIDCTILAEKIIRDDKRYYRWADYTLENNNLYIKYRATMDDTPIDLHSIPEWENIEDISISNVTKMLFMYVKSPVDSREENEDYGVPITYGAEKQIKKIEHTLEQIEREYDLKEVFVGADESMFKGDNALPLNGLYKKIRSGETEFWEVFDPAFRDTPLFNKLMNQCAMLEKIIGTSKGIVTERESGNATATEIKSSLKDTFDLVDDIRSGLNDGLQDFLYACDVLINYYNLAPQGKYELKTDWDYSLIEDSQSAWNQLMQAESRGAVKKAELRQFIRPEETLEEAQAIIDEIKENNPTTKDLLGE